MSNGKAGLTLQEAFNQSEAEEAVAAATPEPASEGAKVEDVSQVEQSAIEEPRNIGLFHNVRGDGVEQPLDEDSMTVDVDGEEISIAELRKGYMRQADYTQKTQDVAQKERDLEKAKTLYDALQENPAATIRVLSQRLSTDRPGLTSSFGESSRMPSLDVSGSGNVGQEGLQEMIQKAVKDALAQDQRLQSYEQEKAFESINGIFEGIQHQYGVELTDEDKRVVLEEAESLGTTDLDFVFAGLYQRQQMFEKQKQNAEANSTVSGRRTVSSEQDETELDISDIRKIWDALEDQEL